MAMRRLFTFFVLNISLSLLFDPIRAFISSTRQRAPRYISYGISVIGIRLFVAGSLALKLGALGSKDLGWAGRRRRLHDMAADGLIGTTRGRRLEERYREVYDKYAHLT